MASTIFTLGASPQTRAQRLEDCSRVWKTLHHANVARFYGFMSCSEGMPALVLDFYPNGNINEFLRRQDPKPNNDIKLTLVQYFLVSFHHIPDTVSTDQGDRTWHAVPPRISAPHRPWRYSGCEYRTSEPKHIQLI